MQLVALYQPTHTRISSPICLFSPMPSMDYSTTAMLFHSFGDDRWLTSQHNTGVDEIITSEPSSTNGLADTTNRTESGALRQDLHDPSLRPHPHHYLQPELGAGEVTGEVTGEPLTPERRREGSKDHFL